MLAVLVAYACGEPPSVARLRVKPPAVSLPHGVCRPVTFHWEMLRPLDKLRGHPVLFVHLLEGPHHVVRTFDQPLDVPWRPGSSHDQLVDLCQSAIAPSLAASRYQLSVGLYESDWGYRWPLDTGGTMIAPREYEVASVVVPAASVSRSFRFEGSWNPPEETGDRQVVVRRSMKGHASIRVLDDRAVKLHLHVGQAVSGAPLLRSSCASGQQYTLKFGDQRIALPGCANHEISIDANGAAVNLELLALDYPLPVNEALKTKP
jgi:hypothetical protein